MNSRIEAIKTIMHWQAENVRSNRPKPAFTISRWQSNTYAVFLGEKKGQIMFTGETELEAILKASKWAKVQKVEE